MAPQHTVTALYEGLRVTSAQYFALAEDPNFRYDVVDAVMRVSPSPTADHSNTAVEFIYRLRSYLERNPVGRIYTELDVQLPDGGDPFRPDLQLILNSNREIVNRWVFGTPDLIVEILSDSKAARDLKVKSERYLQCGVREFWILDPRDRSLRVRYSSSDLNADLNVARWEEKRGETLASRLLPGFTASVAEIFP